MSSKKHRKRLKIVHIDKQINSVFMNNILNWRKPTPEEMLSINVEYDEESKMIFYEFKNNAKIKSINSSAEF